MDTPSDHRDVIVIPNNPNASPHPAHLSAGEARHYLTVNEAKFRLLEWANTPTPPEETFVGKTMADVSAVIRPKLPLLLGAGLAALIFTLILPRKKGPGVGKIISLSLILRIITTVLPFINRILFSSKHRPPLRTV